MSDALKRFLNYVQIDTQSSRESDTYPSTSKQLNLARVLVAELEKIGLEDVRLDEWGYVTATLPANMDTPCPVVGFLAHMDTSPDASGEGVRPRVVEGYDGGDILLNAEKNIYLSPREFPELSKRVGEDLVVTDGTTLLGADDKAGVDHFDVPAFGADFAFTVDGGELGELEYENFNAAGAEVIIHGRSVHPGSAKGKLLNAALIGMEYQGLLPVFQRPENTEGREGFIHLFEMRGAAENARLEYIIRDHAMDKFEAMKQEMLAAADFLNRRYGAGTVEVTIRDQYFNMREMIEPHPQILDVARRAYRELGIEPKEVPVRGGTDGSRLSYMGLPTPNLFTGGGNYHGRFEYLSVNGLEKSHDVIVRIAALVAEE